VAACTQPASPGLTVENETPHVTKLRRDLVEMLFHEGNHLCPICEASGNCELQAMAYRLDMTEPTRFPYLEPCRAVDASHPDIALDTNRCISCGRCIRASQDVDGKGIFGYVGRGIHRRVAVNGEDLAHTDAEHRRCRRLGGCLPGRLHHPQTRRLLGADRRARVRQGPDRLPRSRAKRR
jgi:[NiFe] hydrogenase diaphorase moiety small subunit